ncbi:hypothetical protein [Melittangium boletus]|uniref:hypothetical protein n=1 Tax=Melittangium boletus TaxID=83453 RepID=UPI003DA21911
MRNQNDFPRALFLDTAREIVAAEFPSELVAFELRRHVVMKDLLEEKPVARTPSQGSGNEFGFGLAEIGTALKLLIGLFNFYRTYRDVLLLQERLEKYDSTDEISKKLQIELVSQGVSEEAARRISSKYNIHIQRLVDDAIATRGDGVGRQG